MASHGTGKARHAGWVSEDALVADCLEGNSRAVAQLLSGYRQPIHQGACRALTGYHRPASCDADDLAQEFCVELVRNQCRLLKLFDSRRGCLCTFLRRVSVRRCWHFVRRRAVTWPANTEQAAPDLDQRVAVAPPASEAVDLLDELVAVGLPPQLQAVIRALLTGQSMEHLAEEQRISLSAAYRRRERAIRYLHEQLVSSEKGVTGRPQ